MCEPLAGLGSGASPADCQLPPDHCSGQGLGLRPTLLHYCPSLSLPQPASLHLTHCQAVPVRLHLLVASVFLLGLAGCPLQPSLVSWPIERCSQRCLRAGPRAHSLDVAWGGMGASCFGFW